MKAYLLHGKRDLRLEEIPDPVPAPEEVVVKVKSAGICGSDIHYFKEGRIGDYVPLNPFVPGHEFSGEVVQTGANVREIKAGMRVAVDPVWSGRLVGAGAGLLVAVTLWSFVDYVVGSWPGVRELVGRKKG